MVANQKFITEVIGDNRLHMDAAQTMGRIPCKNSKHSPKCLKIVGFNNLIVQSMRKIILAAVLVTFTAGSVMAQTESKNDSIPAKTEKKGSKFGSFIRKVGESTTGINMSNETFVAMDINAQQLIEMTVTSCVGDKATGNVILTLAVKAKKGGVKTALGKSCGNGNQECVTGYDTKGNAFEGREIGSYSEISGQKENPTGIPVQYQFAFSVVPASLAAIEVVMVEFYIYSPSGNVGSNMSKVEPIQVRNIPIQWDTSAAE
ncbi:MAG: hypothetical protein LBR36_03245 [Bacteroidales bacterium]|jgi:hypothetical protein|nr:hypothetical protein [Bacteroidales bacterium]